MTFDTLAGTGSGREAQIEIARFRRKLTQGAHSDGVRHAALDRGVGCSSHEHLADRHFDADGHAETEPAELVVLQAISRTLHFDEAIAALARKELDQIGQSGPIGGEVRQNPLEAAGQVLG